MTSDSVELIKGDNRDPVHLMTFVLGIQGKSGIYLFVVVLLPINNYCH